MIQEQLVLASILIDNRHMKKCVTVISPDDFVDFKNKSIYQGMLQLHYDNMEIDYGTLIDYLDRHKTGVTIEYLIHLSDILPTAANIDSYLKQLVETSNRRKLEKAFNDVLKDDTVTSQEASQYITNVIEGLDHIDNTPVDTIHDGIDEYVNSLADGNFVDTAHKTLFTNLDEKVAIQDGDYILVAGFTGTGKSALVMNYAKNFSMQGKKGLIISGEMTRQQMLNRMIANVSGVANKRIQRKIDLNKDELLKISRSAKEIKKLDIMINDKGNMTVEHIVNLSRKLKQKGRLDYLIVDHIGLIGTTKRCNGKTQEISHVSNTLKQLALNLKIPVIVLSQFNRNASDSHTGKRREPVKEDLKHSGSLEEDANVIIFLYSTNDNIEDFVDRYMILKVDKNRDGECGKMPVVFKADKQMFREVEYDRDTQTSTELPLSKV
ncbi:DnaB-like replicative helicase [PinkBerry-associated phage LS06-2018-MD08]|nr:DnaB-like replicative helicase [PinkBerry-associated phage LS06-2018-MD08]